MIDLIESIGDASADFHSALIATYRLDLELYDGLVRRVLNKAGVTNQVVFCDFNAYVEAVTMQRPRYVGRQYSVVPVRQPGAFHWLISPKGTPLSNPVAITWPEVGQPRRAGGLGKKIERGLLGIHDGIVLGTILFELLDSFRDFEVIRVAGRQPASPRSGDEPAESAEQRPAEFFYTDAPPGNDVDPRWTGDRLDLDILASLVQPLSTGAKSAADEEEDDDEFDESRLAEEAERRQIDKQQGKATGAERDQVPGVSSEKLERAIRRFERRLQRAAEAIERSLEYVDKLQSIPPQSIARQVWMTQIGAFLASRTVTSDDGEEFECVSPLAFAQYVIRISRALVGSLRGGFLNRLPDSLWETADGDILRRGLGFLRTCVVWATAFLASKYDSAKPDDEIWPDHLACAVPELVGARLVARLDALGIGTDEDDLTRRFPAFAEVPSRILTEIRKKVERLAKLIISAEAGNAVEESSVTIPAPGMVVYNEKLGVTVVMNYAPPSYYWLADLSRPGDEPAKYRAHVRPVGLDGVTPTVGCWYAPPGIGD